MKNFTLGLIVAFVLSAGFAYADTVQQIQSPIYKDDIGRSHFLGKGGYSTTRHLQMQEAGAAAVNAFAEKTGVTYPMALDPGADIFAKYADREAGITRNVLIDRSGKIVMLTRLYNEDEFAALCKKIDQLLAQ